MVKGSIDYLGINHYTSYYMKGLSKYDENPVSYQDDWHVGFACKQQITNHMNLKSQNYF